MTKLEQLKVAYEAATPGLWSTCKHATPDYIEQHGVYADQSPQDLAIVRGTGNSEFIALAHNLMPTLLEAIDLLETVSSARACQDHEFDVDAWFKQVRSLMFKLK